MQDFSFARRLDALSGQAGRAHWIEGPAELRFGAARARSDRIVAAFAAEGIAPGECIAVATDSDVALAPILLAALRMGLTLLPLSGEATASEAKALIERAAPTALIADEGVLASWREVLAAQPKLRIWTLAGQRSRGLFGFGRKASPDDFEAALDAVAPVETTPAALDPERDLLLLATSGSSGTPKLARLTVGNLIAQADTFRRELGLDRDARLLNLSPAIHVDGITGIFCALWNGFTLVRPGRFSVDRLSELLHAFYRYRVTHALLVPTLLQLLARLSDDLRAALATGDLRLIISTAAPLPDALWAEIERRTSIPVVNMFGLTETGNVLFTRPHEAADHGTLGRAVDCEVRLVRDDGVLVTGAGEGELEVSGPPVSPGYLGAARDTPWFPTGDLVARDAAGLFRLIGRKKNVIITGGRNVSPEEVDAALASHPDVLAALTVGLPDEVWGERVESCVVLRDGSADLDAIARHAALRLSPYKQPRALHRRDTLPRGPSGKPLRHVVQAELLAAQAPEREAAGADVSARIIAIAAEVLRAPASSISRASRPGAPRTWDSLAHLQLVQRLEETFDVELLPREITRIDSLGRAIDLVAAKLPRGQGR